MTNTKIVLTAPNPLGTPGTPPVLKYTRNGVVVESTVAAGEAFDFVRLEITGTGYEGTLVDGTYTQITDPAPEAFTIALSA